LCEPDYTAMASSPLKMTLSVIAMLVPVEAVGVEGEAAGG